MFGQSIVARLGLDTAGFKTGLGKAQSSLSGFAKTAAGALGFTIGVAGIEQALEKIIAYGDKIQDLSDRYNVNAESLQRLGNVAATQGSSLEGVAQGFNKLLINTAKARSGNVEMIDSFASLGVTLDDLRSLSPEEMMLKIGKSSMNAAAMVAILGKSALELRPTLDGLATGALKYGNAISSMDIKKLAEAKDLIEKLNQELLIMGSKALVGAFESLVMLGRNFVSIFQTMGTAVDAWVRSLSAAAKFDFTEAIEQFKRLRDVKIEIHGLDKEDETRPPRQFADEDEETLKERAARPKVFSNAISIQEWWEGEEARKILAGGRPAGKATAGASPPLGDLASASFTMDRAHGMRQSFSGVPTQAIDIRAIDATQMATNIQTIATEMLAE